jgi:hypothetical protein
MAWKRRLLVPTALIAAALCSCGRARATHPLELWFYDGVNLAENDAIKKIAPVWKRAAAAGYTKVMLADGKLARPGDLNDRYRDNARQLVALAASLHLEIVPIYFDVGRGNGATLAVDPNLAEAVPVRDARFTVRGGTATLTPDPPVTLAAKPDEVEFGMSLRDGIASVTDPLVRARMRWRVTVSPFRCYHLSVKLRTEKFKGQPVIRVTDSKRRLEFTSTRHQKTQDWTDQDIVFDPLGARQVEIVIGVVRRARGTAQWKDWRLEEAGPVNLVRRPGAPLVVRDERTGRVLEEGRDFDALADTLMGNSPWPGQFDDWHAPPALRTPRLADGTVLRVSWYHAAVVGKGQVAVCLSDTAVTRVLAAEAASTRALFGSRAAMLGIDEIRAIGWDAACTEKARTPARILADHLRAESDLLPGMRLYVWNDMFDPLHNAVPDYYLVNGDLTGSWDGLDSTITVVNWNGEHRAESLRFFSRRGHEQVIAAYYDGKPGDVRNDLAAAAGVPGVTGVLYATWKDRYDDLEAFAREVTAAGWR